jgi:hypothetical protein
MEKFIKGDLVIVKNYNTTFNGKVGVIIGTSRYNSNNMLVKFYRIYNSSMQHQGHYNEDPTKSSRYIPSINLKYYLSEKERKIKEQEIIDKKLKRIEKYRHIDPYGEEEWENENEFLDIFPTYENIHMKTFKQFLNEKILDKA